MEKNGEKTGEFSGSQEGNYTKISKQRNMNLSSILTLLKINLSYLELFYDTIYQVLLVLSL